ncbi:ABC transporter permease [Petropleomorpha daqingensis]|uniref:ABC-type transport system involved in multi-copper enzyme maturation permease subunit n=1 Tax=Petropleomorpha daqingensis TaxID=2026353 RepID=A0A853C931_9ACTN|nr:ABC transporter permease [Petropleomorpha daqingensis]NYJ04480.1 ABC-type transport system involved in multi-copper enzyme maturation permease subunit [Petropleomorpha daqingensis]
MTRLVRAEWTKLFTTRVWIGLLLGACVLAGGFSALFTGLAGVSQNGQPGLPAVGTSDYEQLVFSVGANASVLLLILGIIGMTQEYRHRTATPTFLTTPRRGNVVIGKLLAYALVAVPFALLILAVNVLVVEIYAGARGDAPALNADNLQTLGAAGLVLVVFSVIGVGVGALLRNQVGAIVGSLVYLYVVEPIVSSISAIQPAYKWLPGGAVQAITSDFQAPDLLEPWQGVLLLLGYGLVAALLGTFLAVRRDVV